MRLLFEDSIFDEALLAVGRYSCIAQNHGMVLLLYYAPEKPFLVNWLGLLNNRRVTNHWMFSES